ncbi:MAG: hypothetical protein II376_03970 [Clostridia bacterium]|nr:hypothetical protein [Clostridia bacterium]
MKTLKRLLALTMAVMMLSAFSINVMASEVVPGTPPEEIDPEEYIVSCSSGGKHQMLAKGTGYVYNAAGNDHIVTGNMYQCTQCYLILVTSGHMLIPDSVWGQYAIKDYGLPFPFDSSLLNIETDTYGEKWVHDDFSRGFEFIRNK